jgi:hypothetical protein
LYRKIIRVKSMWTQTVKIKQLCHRKQ